MSEFRKLFRARRILAMTLAIAMAVTSIPATANAAPLQPQVEAEQAADETPAADEADGGQSSDDQNAPSDGSEVQDGDSSTSQGSGEDSGAGDQSGAEDSTDAADDANTGDDNTGAEDNTGADDSTDAGSDPESGDTTDGTDVSGTEGDAEAGTDSALGGEETTDPAETEKEYAFVFSDDFAEYTSAQYRQGEALFAIETDAADGAEAGMTVNTAILERITLENTKDENDTYNLGYASEADIVKALTYSWKGLEKGKSPRESGAYQLEIKLPAKTGEYTAAETTIDFQITKAEVNIEYGVSDVNPGDLVSDVALNYAAVSATDGKYFTYEIDDKATDENEAADNEVAFDLVIREAVTNNVLKSDVKLVKNIEYVVGVTPKFIGTNAEAYAKNYEFNQAGEQNIVVNDLIKTRVQLSLNAKYDNAQYKKESTTSAKNPEQQIDKITLKSYDGSAITATEPQVDKVEVGVPGVDQDDKETFDVIQGAVTENAWHSAVYESWTEGGKPYCNLTVGGELEGAPTEAGVYVYRVSYEGDEQQYAPSYADIVVEIEVVNLIMQPKFDATPKSFYAGQTAADVLAQISYELPYADKDGKFTIPEEKKASFWGTSYVNAAKTQPYEPVFEVVKTTTVTENGTQASRTEILDADDLLVYDEKGTTTYEVRFTGYKAVYNANGSLYMRKGINDPADSTTNNYVVKADQETLKQYTASFEIKNMNAEIDPSAIIDGFTTNADFHKAAVRTYDGTRLFANRADYKKAQLKSGGTSVPGVASTDLTYKWYRSSYQTIMDTKVSNIDGAFEEVSDFGNSFYVRNDLISPVNAGIYKLVISYQDKEGKYFAEPVEVYFVIERQKLQIRLSDKEYEEFSGVTVSQFLSDTEIEYSIVPELTKPVAGDAWQQYGYSTYNYPYIYDVTWQVEEKQRDADGNALKDDEGNEVYSPLQNYESFVYDAQNFADSYRLSVADFSCYNSNYTVTETTIEDGEKNPDDPNAAVPQYKVTKNLSITDANTAKITVNQMGTTAIRIDMDQVIEKEKDYNGVSIYDVLKDDLAKIKVVKDNEDGTTTEIKDVNLSYTVTDIESDMSIILEEMSEEEFDLWAKYDLFINGGTYVITAQYRGDAVYASMAEQEVARVTVKAIPLTITPPTLEDTVVAGTRAYEVTNKAANAFGTDNIEGYLERDKYYFNKSALYYTEDGQSRFYGYGYSAWFYDNEEGDWEYNLPRFSVLDQDAQAILENNAVLKGESEDRYRLTLEDYNSGQLTGRCARNYYTVCGEATSVRMVRGNASLRAVEYGNIADVDTVDSISGMTHTLKVLDGIKYISYQNEDGNFVAVEIVAPAEYAEDSAIWSRAVYEASVRKAGGTIVRGSHYVDGRYAITAVFDARKGATEFGIRWEEDYVETFKLAFSEADCLGNLGDAVSPKTIAFNAPNKNMVVGETQELDVKITKLQKDDVICLGYEVDKAGQQYLCVNEYGKVTALKAGGSATVTAYPMHLVDGVKVPIEGKDVKKASVTIKVKDVTAPKISKVTPLDYQVTVQYPYVKDVNYNYGYRREIYVLEGKNLKEQEFKDKIAEMSNEQWQGIFAAAPVFLTNGDEWASRIYDGKKHSYTDTVSRTIRRLKPNTDYTVYVRNVSAVRTLSDGCLVTESAAGSVKGFTTTKSQIKGLEITLQDRTETDKEGEIGKGSLSWIEYDDVKLSEGSVQLQAKGYFESWAKDPAAEPVDEEGGFDIDSSQPFVLSLSKDQKQYYVDPKISYYFWTYADGEGYYDAYSGQAVKPGEYYRSATSSIASIDKKGKLTLKQPGWVEMIAVDTTTGVWSNQIDIRISAEADAIKGKTTKLQVGQSMRLENLIEYKEGKKVLDQAWYNTSGRVDRNGLKDQIEAGGFFELSDGGYITALKGNGNIRVTLTDKVLNESTQVTVKSVDLAPVKGLKAVNVIDNRFTVQFERNPFAQAYRIDVRNARGNLIRSVYAEDYKVGNYYREYYDENTGEYVGTIYDVDSDWDDDYQQGDWRCYYDRKTGRTYGEYTVKGLTQQSKYTFTVQALYRDVASKAVSKGATTTKLPAAEYDLDKEETGGINIYVWNYDGHSIGSHIFVSGNDYTLVAEPENWGAKYAATDTLIWSSSNKKAATIKPNAGSYSAMLRAVRNGSTTIEVKSKITGKVIARYHITVRNVGDAYTSNNYYGDNEDLRGDGTANKPACTELILGKPSAVDLDAGKTKWFAFTALEDGTYNFYRMQNGTRSTYGFTVYNAVQNGSSIGNSVYMTAGETVYVQATMSGAYTINVEKQKGTGPSDRTPLEIGSVTMQVTGGQYFVFTAAGEGIYSFSGRNFRVEDIEGSQKTQGSPAQCWLDDGETVYLCALGTGSGQYTITVEKMPVQSLTADQAAAEVVTDAYGKAWFSFTAPKAAEYEFVLSGAGWDSKYIRLYNRTDITNAIANEYNYTNESISLSYMLGSGTTVLVDAGPSGNKLEVKTKAAVETVTTGEDKNITLTETNQYFEFAAPADGFYRFTSAGADGVSAELYKDLTGEAVDTFNNYSGDAVVSCYLKSGQHAYFVVRSYSGDAQADVTIKVESVTPEKIGEAEVSSEIGSYSDKWFSYTAGENEKYTFTFTSDMGCSASLYTLGALGADHPVPVKELYVAGKKHFDYEMTAKQTVYWRVKNNSYSSANVTVKAAKYTIPALGEGSEDFDIETQTAQVVTFTAAEAGKYTFRFRSNSNNSFRGYLYSDAGLTDQIDSLWISNSEQKKECNMAAGETVYWKLDNTTGRDVTVTVSVEKFAIYTMAEGENSFNVNYGFSQYYSFTAPEAGDYIFAFKSDNGYSGNAYKYPDMYFTSYEDSIYFYSSYGKKTYTLAAQETVYWKIANNSGSDMEVTALVKKDVPVEITADGVSAEVSYGLEQWFSYTADADARYRFTFTSDTSYCYAYFYLDRNGSSEGSTVYIYGESTATTDERIIEAGKTVYWKIENNNSKDTIVTVKAEKIPMTAVTEGTETSANIVSGATELFSISLPEDNTEYVITVMSMNASCNAYLYSDLSMSYASQIKNERVYAGDGNSKNWYISSAEAGNMLYLKVTNNSAVDDTKFKVSVKKRTEESITENSSAVTIAPGAEQWFSYTAAEDMRYVFTLTSDAQACDWYLYKSDDLTSSDNTWSNQTEPTPDEIYIPKDGTIRWKVKNRSVSDSTSVTVTAKAIAIQEIAAGTEMQSVTVAGNSTQWLSYTVTDAGRYEFTFNSASSCKVTSYSNLSVELGYNDSFSVFNSCVKDYYLSGTMYFKVENQGSADVTLTIKAKPYAVEELDAESGNSFDTKAAWYRFTAATAGLYSFYNQADSGNNYRKLDLYKELSDSNAVKSVSNTDSIEYSMNADETVYLKVYSTNDTNVTGTLRAETITVVDLSLGSDTTVNLTKQLGFARFVAPETGIYSFSPAGLAASSARGNMYLNEDLAGNTNIQSVYFYASTTDETFSLVYPLIAGDTVYLKVKATSSDTPELSISTVKDQAMEEVTADQESPVSLKADEAKWICFRTDEEQYQYYMNAAWDGEAGLEIKYSKWQSWNAPYNSVSWKSNMSEMTKLGLFTDADLYTYNKKNVFCVCITPTQDVDITVSFTTERQN